MREYHVTVNKSFPTAKAKTTNTAFHMVNAYHRFQFER